MSTRSAAPHSSNAEAAENGCTVIAFEELTRIRDRLPDASWGHEWGASASAVGRPRTGRQRTGEGASGTRLIVFITSIYR
ncbi:hypothetical protein BRC60_03820 [Halobacteriales archaeon QH_1_68_42]|nr:MAG: hypothetical protein BRC60_03820 [Halobacteriales archaeon QH_1_68_42]